MSFYVLGVDGGGTKTTCLLVDDQDLPRGFAPRGLSRGLAPRLHTCARTQTGPSNRYAVGDEAANAALRQAITDALAQAAVAADRVSAICLGMAGVDRPGDAAAVERVVRDLLPAAQVLIHNDAVIALAGGVGRLYGVVLIAGTGAIAYGVNAQGQSRRASGWGHLLGDEGSGYDVGISALRAILRAHDGRGPATALRELVLSHWHLAQPDDLIGLVYAPDFPRRRIASLLPLVEQAAAAGDAVACDLLTSAGRELGLAATAVIRGLGMQDEQFEIVLAGGAFNTRVGLRPEVVRTIATVAPRATTIDPRHEPAMGAALLALEAVRAAGPQPSQA